MERANKIVNMEIDSKIFKKSMLSNSLANCFAIVLLASFALEYVLEKTNSPLYAYYQSFENILIIVSLLIIYSVIAFSVVRIVQYVIRTKKKHTTLRWVGCMSYISNIILALLCQWGIVAFVFDFSPLDLYQRIVQLFY